MPIGLFEKIVKEGDIAIEKTKKRIARELKNKKSVSLGDYIIELIKKEISDILIAKFSLSADSVKNLHLEIPPACIKADLSVPLFNTAKELNRDLQKTGEEATAVINFSLENSTDNLVASAQSTGPYLNIILKKEKIYSLILSHVVKLKNKFGDSAVNDGKIALIDYSGPNIAKPFGVGHLRSTVIGQAVANICEKTGFIAIKDNHLGDWGTQFGKLVYGYQQWGDKKKIVQSPIKELNALYVRFHEEAEKNPALEDEARNIFNRMEGGDKKTLNLWNKFRKISVAEFKKIYNKLDIKFDIYLGESYFAEKSGGFIKEALDKKIASIDIETGAVVVESLEGLPSFLLRKQDGSSLYITRDLAALKFRTENFKPNEIFFVVGEEQSLHFKQLFALARALGYINGGKAKHISFGLVLSDGEKMSTRKGTLVELEDLIDQSVAKSKEILLQKNKDIGKKELDEISEIIGVGAIIYNDLRQSREKNISFDWKRMLDFEGGSAVYLQYTCARINSIIKKLVQQDHQGFTLPQGETLMVGEFIFEKEIEFEVAKKLMFYPHIILQAQKTGHPHLVATYLEELARLFNNFYNAVSIIGTEEKNLRLSRVALIKSVAIVIKNGLGLLNIKTPEKI